MEASCPAPPLIAFVRKYRTQIVAFVSSIVITALVVIFREQLAALRGYGYLGVFLISMVGNATVLFPVPSLAVVFAGGGVLDPLLVGLVAGVGQPLGELTGYLAGYGGSAVIEDRRRAEQLRVWMQRHGFLTLLVLSAIPNPLFDIAGAMAGLMRYPVPKFLLACWLGKTIKSIAIAFLGAASLGMISPWLGG